MSTSLLAWSLCALLELSSIPSLLTVINWLELLVPWQPMTLG
jgi:hypothetical protein